MLSLILPTRNEAKSLPAVIQEIREALAGVPHEIVIVDDDSPDGTWKVAQGLGDDVRVIRRIGRRGLSSAVVEGFSEAKGSVLIAMDADGQHDPAILGTLYDAVQKNGISLAIGSRYVRGGSVEGWKHARHFASIIATTFSWIVTEKRVRDPMTGFFAISRTTYKQIAPKLRPRGFKILLEILAWLPVGAKVREVPLVFRKRKAGKSKLSLQIELQFFSQILSLFLKGRGGKQWVTFLAFQIFLALLLMPRAWDLRLLYVDQSVRESTEEALERLTSEQGWLLSDISLREVEENSVRFIHRPHVRGKDPWQCFVLTTRDSKLYSCLE